MVGLRIHHSIRGDDMSIERYQTGPRMSQAVVHAGTAYFAGQVANDLDADVATQTAQVLAKIDRLLATVDSDKSRLLAATIWIRDMADFAAMNEVWDAWVAEGRAPARACVQAAMARPEFLVEIMVTAAAD